MHEMNLPCGMPVRAFLHEQQGISQYSRQLGSNFLSCTTFPACPECTLAKAPSRRLRSSLPETHRTQASQTLSIANHLLREVKQNAAHNAIQPVSFQISTIHRTAWPDQIRVSRRIGTQLQTRCISDTGNRIQRSIALTRKRLAEAFAIKTGVAQKLQHTLGNIRHIANCCFRRYLQVSRHLLWRSKLLDDIVA